jgi:LmbE family N-acetylglucosaminyl deacetylase
VTRTCLFALAAATSLAAASPAAAQSPARPAAPGRGIAELRRSLDGITTTARVLLVGMHPDDELPQLSSRLSLGRHVETAVLSITRGESGEDFSGPETGPSLGVVRVAEALNARRIDGAHQYFTRAYDFGPVRAADELFMKWVDDSTVVGTWNRDSIVADVVTVIRAFRPDVIIAVNGDTIAAGSGTHQALASLMTEAFGASTDTARFHVEPFGAPWAVAKLYRAGPGIRITTSELDRTAGRTYTAIGADIRAQQRSQGPGVMARPVSDTVELEMIASRVNREGPDSSLFYAVDTSFARLGAGSPEIAAAVARMRAIADSLRPIVDLMNADSAVRPLSELAALAGRFRRLVSSCNHASSLASMSVVFIHSKHVCDQAEMDRDAAADLIRERATAAVFAAAGIEITATADRELLARLDTATVTVKITNHGVIPVRLAALSVHRAVADSVPFQPIVVAPDSSVSLVRRVERIPSADPWWIGRRSNERYPEVLWPRDGVNRAGAPPTSLAPAQAIPEDLHRATDVSLLLDIDGAEVVTSIGPVLHRHVDPVVGVQNRELSGVPEVTIRFARNLEWLPISKPVNRVMRVKIESYSDHPVVLGLGKAAEPGIIVDAIPKEVRLEPHEQRELLLPIRGRIKDQARQQFLFWGVTPQIVTYQMGYQPVERTYLEPARIPRATGAFLQGVDVTVPRNLTVFYVPEGVDDIRSVLTQVGVTAREISPEVLLTADLTNITTIVLASRAVERFPEIGAQANRLMNFVRRGGTLVIQRGGDTTLASKLLPFPVSLSQPAERVLDANAPVKVIAPTSRVLTWPNRITSRDWDTWILGRADPIPTTADPRYQRVIEVHDRDQPENRNAILIAHVGKGTIVYTSLTFDQQIAGASTGALRLFVNLLSAGLPR